MKKLICMAFAVLLVLGVCACGKNETAIYGPFSVIDGKIALEGVCMGDDYDDAKAAIEGKKIGTVETYISSEDRSFEVYTDAAREVNGISYNILSFTADLKDNDIIRLGMGFQHEEVDDVILNDTEKLKKTIDEFFAPYKDAAKGMENVLVTELPTIEYRTDENGNREDMVFSYDGNEIYTMAFVDGKPVSRSEAAKTEGAVILEIYFYAGSLSQSDIDHYLNDDGQTYMGSLFVGITVYPAEMFS